VHSRSVWIALFLSPAITLMAVFMVWPALAALGYSLYDWNAFTRTEFAGFKHFLRLATPPYRGEFLAALGHNTITFLVVVTVQNGLALLLAYGLYRKPVGFAFFRGTVFLPVILSLVITAYLWQLFLHPLFGPLTKFAMEAFRLEEFAPLGDSRLALGAAIVISIWRNIGFPTIVFLAGMNAISGRHLQGRCHGWRQRLADLHGASRCPTWARRSPSCSSSPSSGRSSGSSCPS
jgi:raffinose/stachyose/melibiose transport system permease protein